MCRVGAAILVLVLALAMGTPAFALIGTLDTVPAATLLVPYFQVDLNDPNGVTTLLSINNASAGAILAHVTVWSDLSRPTLAFDVYLTGYDVYTLNLRDLFTTGVLPATSTTVSPQGAFSSPDVNFPGCAGQLPLPPLAPEQLAHIRAAHTGQPSAIFGGQCSGVDFGDNVARGYITVDTVGACSILHPGSPGYFGPGGIAVNHNVLWGDFFYVDSANNFAQGENLVQIEAAPAGFFVPGDYTFYGRYVAFTAVDQREGLATTWAARFLNGGVFDGGTNLVVWRDSKSSNTNPFSCALVAPPPFPLSHTQIVAFDEQENPDIPEPPTFFPPVPDPQPIIPWEANLVTVGGPDLPVAFTFGWLYLNLNTSTGSVVDPFTQNYVAAIHSAAGRFSVGLSGLALDNVTNPNTAIIGP
ncbi:MAG: hypothetical protein ACREKH_19240 [Candidatus Rokuibacteriota bacterium]